MLKSKFVELMKKGNSVITGGFIEIGMNGTTFAALEFDDMSNSNDGEVDFSYVDRDNDTKGWRGERSPFFGLMLDKIVTVEQQAGTDNLFGKYQLRVDLKDMYINLHFDIKNDIVDVEQFGLLPDVSVENVSEYKPVQVKQQYLDTILEHQGTFLINVNAGDFVELNEFGFEAYNLIFCHVKTLSQSELLSFDNSTMAPDSVKADNTPIYSMDFSTNFYIEVKNIESIEKLTAEDYQDVFEYPTKRIFNVCLNNATIITIGLCE